MRYGRPLRERLYGRLTPDPETGCLLWGGFVDSTGYGRIVIARRSRRVHIVAWELEHGPVPDGLQLDHVRQRGCIYRHCANLAHLEPVTSLENWRRGQSFSAVNATKTHCPADHLYDEANTYFKTDGGRQCRACNRDAVRRYKARQPARAAS
jgi:hypothetical protein